jgi:hypothetical protein
VDSYEFSVLVERDPTSGKKFFAATAHGPQSPEDYACEYLLQHGTSVCHKTQNDCWDVLARVVAGPLTQTVPLTNGYRLCSGRDSLSRALGDRGYDRFLALATKSMGSQREVTKAWCRYRDEEMPMTLSGRRLLGNRRNVLEGFFGQLLPQVSAERATAIVDWIYTDATGLALRGMPDLMSIRSGGVCFVEVKSPGDQKSDIQRDVHARLWRLGLPVFVCQLTEERG